MREILTPQDAAQIVQQLALASRASVADQIAQRPFSVQIETVDLSTARTISDPKKISGQFRSIYIQSATDTIANIQVIFGSRDSVQSAFSMRQNDSVSMDLPVSEAYIYWAAQAGKTLTFVTFTNARFESGSQISVSGGGVSINEGSTVGAATRVTLVAATAAIIAAQNTSRKTCLIQNNTGGDLFISGTSAVTNTGATRGITLSSGAIYEYKNTGALYGYSVGGGDVTTMDMV